MTLLKTALTATAIIVAATTSTSAQSENPYRSCKQEIRENGLHLKTEVGGKVNIFSKRIERPRLVGEGKFEASPGSIRLANGARLSDDEVTGRFVYQYRLPALSSNSAYITDMRFDISGFEYDRVVGYDQLDGTIQIVLRAPNGATLAALPVYSDIYFDKPALDKPLGVSTVLSYGADGGISADKDTKQEFITRVATALERLNGAFTVSIHDKTKGLAAKDAIASFTVDGHDVHGARVLASRTLGTDAKRLDKGQCPPI